MSETNSRQRRVTRRNLLLVVAVLITAVVAVLLRSGMFREKEASAIPLFTVRQDEFVITLELRGGELEAKSAENVVSPRVRGQLKIVELFPEGEQAEVGDLLVQYEQTDFERRLLNAEEALENVRADLERTRATQKAEIARLEGAIKDAEANLRLAELQVERMAFEATVERERAEIQAQKAVLSHQQAVDRLESQKVVNQAEIRKRELDIGRHERELQRAREELESTIVKAEKPGLVVYGRMWKGDRHEKIRVGDEIWGGINVISLPDLSRMQVNTSVNEVDVDKLKVGQTCTIKLDALPEPTFHGHISSIASLGRDMEGERNVKVFDLTIDVAEQDERLRPGMTATTTVTIETIPAQPDPPPDQIEPHTGETVEASRPLPLFVPQEAIFERDGRTVVYRLDSGRLQAQVVTLGKRNDNYVIIEDGLHPGDRVALLDPTRGADDASGRSRRDSHADTGPEVR